MACGASHASIRAMPTQTEPDNRPRTIIAGCDGDDRGRQAVVFGRTLAGLLGDRLLIVAVYPHPAVPFPPPLVARGDERRRADQAIRAVRDELAPEARALAVPGFSPAQALCEVAERERASAIVVGSRHPSRRRMGDADHALQVLRSASAPVFVVPEDRPAPAALQRIVAGFDGSSSAREAIAVAARLAQAAGAHLTVLSALPPEVEAWWLASPASLDAEILEHHRAAREAELRQAAGEVLREHPGVDASLVVEHGHPVPRLLAAGEEADLLVVGSRRWGAIGRLVLGTVSEAVVRESPCPTLVVPVARGSASAAAKPGAGVAAGRAD